MKTSSGYYAGLQSGKDFKAVEQNLKRKHVSEPLLCASTRERTRGTRFRFFRPRRFWRFLRTCSQL